MMVTTYVSPSPDLDIPKRTLPFSIDQQVINLISIPAIWRTLCGFVDVSAREKGATYHQIICWAKLDKSFSVFIDDATSIPSHHPVTALDISNNFGI